MCIRDRDYIVDWCTSDLSKGTDTKACSAEFTNGRYKKTLTRGVIDIKTRDSLQAIRHESVPCGSARITVRRSGEVVGFREVDTEKQCPTLTTTGLQAEETEEGLPSDNIVELINDLFSIGKSSSDTLDTQEMPDDNHGPATPAPEPPKPPKSGGGTPAPPGSGDPVPETGNAQTDKAVNFYNQLIEKCGSTLAVDNDQYLCLNSIDMPNNIRETLKADLRSMDNARSTRCV